MGKTTVGDVSGTGRMEWRWNRCCRDSGANGPLCWFVALPSELDRLLRRTDFRVHRGVGGLARRWLRSRHEPGHAPLVYLLTAAVFWFIVYGPTLAWRGTAGLIAWLLVCVAYLWCVRVVNPGRLFDLGWGFVVGLSLVVWFALARLGVTESGPGPYRHALIPLAVILLVIAAPLARWLAVTLFARYRKSRGRPPLRDLLSRTELFEIPRCPPVSAGQVLRALVSVPLYHPLHLLYPVALTVLAVDDRGDMRVLGLVVLLLSWLVVGFAGVHNRFNAMLSLVNRWLFNGGQLVVSLAVIGLAIGRWIDFGYISTLVESTPWHVLLVYATSAYVLFWLYEYWLNHILCAALLPLLGTVVPGSAGTQVRYALRPEAKKTAVEPSGRVVQIHGGGRLAVIGRYRDRNGAFAEAFQLMERRALMDRLAMTASGSPMQGLVGELRKRIRFYFMVFNLGLALLATVSGLIMARGFDTVPAVQVDNGLAYETPERMVDLQKALFGSERQRALLVAASGGGTRAALYTASVMRGLGELGMLDDLVLASGVSGGSAALAYFAAHRDLLRGGDPRSWDCYQDSMAAPFIQDVLEGAAEWRIVTGDRLGRLLRESFDRRFYHVGRFGESDCLAAAAARRHLGGHAAVSGDPGLGMIFNTAITGQPYSATGRYCSGETPDACVDAGAADRRGGASAIGAGGRLVFTNLARAASYFPGRVLPAAFGATRLALLQDETLRYVTLRDPSVALTTAAALSANFPPVFSNAAVEVKQENGESPDRYWVTDGGAADNRGVLSLLFALRGALQEELDQQVPWWRARSGTCPGLVRRNLPSIHVVVAEASAMTIDYRDDRGVGARFGSADKFASQLMHNLVEEIQGLYCTLGGDAPGFRVHYLTMPAVFRSRGGLGTHWMLQDTARLVPDHLPDPGLAARHALRLEGRELKLIIDNLHRDPALRPPGSSDVGRVWEWVDRDPHRAIWNALAQSAGPAGPTPSP